MSGAPAAHVSGVAAVTWHDLPDELVTECLEDTSSPYCWCGTHFDWKPPVSQPDAAQVRLDSAADDWRERESSEDDHIMFG